MSNRVNVDLSMNAQGFVDGINQAKGAVADYESEQRKVQDSLGNFKKDLGQARREVMNLGQAYSKLTQEERNSQFGKEMAKQLQEAKNRAAELIDMNADLNQELRNMASDTAVFDSLSQGMNVFMSTTSSVLGVIAQFTGDEEDARRAVVAFTTAQSTLTAVTQIQNALQKQSALMLGVQRIKTLAATAATRLDTAAKGKNVIATRAASVSQKAFNLVANANPYVLLATAIVGVTAALWAFSSGTDDAADKEQKLIDKVNKLKETEEEYARSTGQEYSKLMTKYIELKNTWEELKTAKEKDQFLVDNKDKIKDLTNTVKDAKTAEDFFVKNTENIIQSFKLRAQAAAAAALAVQKYQEAMQLEMESQSSGLRGTIIPKEMTDKIPEQLKKKLKKVYEDVYDEVYIGDPTGGYRKEMQKTRKWLGAYKIPVDVDEDTLNQLAALGLRNAKMLDASKKAAQQAEKYIEKSEQLVNDAQKLNTYDENKNNDTTSTNTKNVKKEIKTYKEAIAEYNKLKKDRNELASTILSGNIGEKGIDNALKEINDLDKQIQEIKDKWDVPTEITLIYNEEDVKKIKDKVNEVLNPSKNESENYDYSYLPKQYNKAADETIAAMQRIEKAREELLSNNYVSYDEFVAAIEGVNELSDAYDELKTKADAYQTLANAAEQVAKKNESIANTLSQIGNAVQSTSELFSALGEASDNKTTKANALIAQAVATVALSFAEALRTAKTWIEWLSFGISGVATMVNISNQIKALKAGSYATGGIVGGSSYYGDRLMANVNSGEMILNKQQQRNLFNVIDKDKLGASNNNIVVTGDVKVKGTDLVIALRNENMKTNKLR